MDSQVLSSRRDTLAALAGCVEADVPRPESPLSTRSRSPSPLCHQGEGEGLPNPCQHVLRELIDTERAYVEALKEVMEGYVEPMTNQDHLPISADDRQALFGNTEDLCEFNKKLAQDFDEAGHDMQALAACFHRNEEGFKKYTEYCNNYPRAVEVLASAQRLPMMAEFFKGCQLALGHMLPLGAYLLKPVQRILKYHLLLADLLKQYGKHVQKDDEAHQELTAARNTMAGVAEYINAMKRKHEASVKTQEVISQVVGWDTKMAVGMLILDDNFRVQGARDRRIIYLFEKVMLVTKRSKEGLVVYKGHVSYSNMTVAEHLKDPLSWEVSANSNKGLQLIIFAKSSQQKQQWVMQLRRLIIENDKNLPDEARKRMLLHLGKENITVTSTTDVHKAVRDLKKDEELPSTRVENESSMLTESYEEPAPGSAGNGDTETQPTVAKEDGDQSPLRMRREESTRLSRSSLEQARIATRRKQLEHTGSEEEESDVLDPDSLLASFGSGSTEVSGEASVCSEGSVGAALLDDVPMDVMPAPAPTVEETNTFASAESKPFTELVEEFAQGSSESAPIAELPTAEMPDEIPVANVPVTETSVANSSIVDSSATSGNFAGGSVGDESDDEVCEMMEEEPDKPADVKKVVDEPDIMVPESHIKEFNLLPRDRERFGSPFNSPSIARRTFGPSPRMSQKSFKRSRSHSTTASADLPSLTTPGLKDLGEKPFSRSMPDKAPVSADVSAATEPVMNSKEMLERTRGLVQRLVKRYTELVTDDDVAEGGEIVSRLPSISGTMSLPRQATPPTVRSRTASVVSTSESTKEPIIPIPRAAEAQFAKAQKKLVASRNRQLLTPSQRAAVNVKRSRSFSQQSSPFPLRRHGSVTTLGLHNAGATFVSRARQSAEARSRRSMYQVFAELRRDGRRIQIKTNVVRPRKDFAPPAGRVRRLIERFSVKPM